MSTTVFVTEFESVFIASESWWHSPRDELQMEMKLLHCSKNNWGANRNRFFSHTQIQKYQADYIYSFIYICLIANKIAGNGIYPINDIIAIRKSKKVKYKDISIWFILTAIIDCTLLCFMIMELLHFLRAAAQMQDQSVYFSFLSMRRKKLFLFIYFAFLLLIINDWLCMNSPYCLFIPPTKIFWK